MGTRTNDLFRVLRPESECNKPLLNSEFYLQNHKTFVNCQTALHIPNTNRTVTFQITSTTEAKIRNLKLKENTDAKFFRNDFCVWSN